MTLLFPRMAPERAKLPCSHTMSAFTSGHGGRSDEARDLLRDLAFLFAFFGERDTRCASYLGDGERWVVDGGSYVVIAPAS
mmetsp:Transcript_15212/g.35211  ORF Transcript_15212/g.35211 Transcript_15212/m.35211 type:complete len:81 (-) Transcript_15212:39-281(-)